MKKYTLLITLASTFPLSFAGQGGYTGPSETNNTNIKMHIDASTQIISVAQAKKLADDRYVSLRGKIVQHLYKDKYLFQDKTGKIKIEIDDDKWLGLSVDTSDLIEIYGEVDRYWKDIEIDVKTIHKVNP